MCHAVDTSVPHRSVQAARSGATAEPTLLIVDDDAANLDLIGRLLRREGLHILTAGSAEDALEMLAINEVGVILPDHRTPGMTGVELLRRVKGLYPDIMRIIVSGEMDVQAPLVKAPCVRRAHNGKNKNGEPALPV